MTAAAVVWGCVDLRRLILHKRAHLTMHRALAIMDAYRRLFLTVQFK